MATSTLLRCFVCFLFLFSMQGKTTFRLVSALASSFRSSSVTQSNKVPFSSSVCGRRRLVQHKTIMPWGFGPGRKNIQGGGFEPHQQLSDQKFRYRSHQATSTSISNEATSSTAPQAVDDSSDSAPIIDKHKIAKDSIGMIGSSIKRSIFGNSENNGIEYYDTSNMKESRVLFVLGGPGAGKGTQSEFLVENYPCVHLSAGELLRAEAKKEDSIHRDLINERLVAGQIVPVEISLSLLQKAMEDAAKDKGDSLIFLVDGFPRNFDNLDGWVRCMSKDGVASVWGVLTYSCPLEELERRILSRAETSGRSDDNIKSAQKRFQTFERETMPVVDTMQLVQQLQEEEQEGEERHPSSKVIDIAADRPIDDVWADTQRIMNNFIMNDILTANAKLLAAIESNDSDTYSSLCSKDMLSTNDIEKTMNDYEQNGVESTISNPSIEFITGTKAKVSYDVVVCNDEDNKKEGLVRETRVWSYEGSRGWTNIHFYRTPISE